MEFVQKLMGQLGRGQMLVMGGVGIALLAALSFIALRGPSAQMAYLYTDLDPSSAAEISQKLQAQNVEYQLSPDGTAILAPQDRLAQLRMSLAGDQLGGKIGYEVLDDEQPFGLSAAREKLNETRAIEGELARSIATLDAVNSARVRIVMPERALFAKEARKASAAITLKARGRLSAENVQAIRNLVASSVPELTPEAVSIVDQKGRLLARAGDADSAGSGELEERQAELENRLRGQIEQLLEPLVGEGRVRAEVNARLNRDSKREEARAYDPDGAVIARQISVESGDQSQETSPPPGGVSVANQLPDAQGAGGGAGDQRQANSNQTSEDVSYDNSHTDTVTLRAPGAIEKLSVAVMIDANAKLPKAQIDKLTRIVESAVGYDEERGDSVVVDSLPFAAGEEVEDMPFALSDYVPTGQIFPLLQLLVVAGVGLLVLRMLKSRGGAGVPALAGPAAALDGGELHARAPAQANGVEGGPVPLDAPAPAPALAAQQHSHMAALDQEIALAQVEGGIKASSLKRIGETISGNPAESASVIRQWMNG